MARTNDSIDRRAVIPAALLETPTRPSFFDGRLLTAEDLRQEQAYHIRKRHLLNLATLGVGVVSGLEVAEDPGGGGLAVSPGLAIDGLGREIIVPADVFVAWPASDEPPRRWGVVIEAAEFDADPVRATDAPVAAAVWEGSAITVITEPPAADDTRVVLRPFGERSPRRSRRRS